jgi:excisionase family DNA binding protein
MVKTITVPDMAQELGVGQRKVYEMLREKQIPNLRSGARYLVSRAAWDLWLSTLGIQQPSTSRNGVLQ